MLPQPRISIPRTIKTWGCDLKAASTLPGLGSPRGPGSNPPNSLLRTGASTLTSFSPGEQLPHPLIRKKGHRGSQVRGRASLLQASTGAAPGARRPPQRQAGHHRSRRHPGACLRRQHLQVAAASSRDLPAGPRGRACKPPALWIAEDELRFRTEAATVALAVREEGTGRRARVRWHAAAARDSAGSPVAFAVAGTEGGDPGS